MLSNAQIETLAARLLVREGGNQTVAFLVARDLAVYYARAPLLQPGTPHSAVTRLLQGVHALDPSINFHLARRRIFSTVPLSAMCWGMLRVAGTRHTSPISALDHGVEIPSSFHEVPRIEPGPLPELELPARVESDAEGIAFALRLARQIDRSGPRFASDRPVGAILVSGDGELLGYAVNSTTRNRTLHAELKLIQDWHARTGRPLPRGARLYTSLKPCRMCAGMIWHCAEDLKSLRVFYAEFDHGPNGRETVLNARTPDRRRALEQNAQSEIKIDAELELQI